jgi:uncharacterized membrane protein YqgA involved in biofilm formation
MTYSNYLNKIMQFFVPTFPGKSYNSAVMKGYVFNSLLVAGGSALGLVAGKKVGETTKETVFSVLGLVTLYVGIKMSLHGNEVLPMVFALVLGTFAGSLLRIEERLQNALSRPNEWSPLRQEPGDCKSRDSYLSGKYNIEGFLVASTLFCVGSMTIIGSLKDGLSNDSTLIRTKSVMDGFASFVIASRYGPSVAFSAVTVLVIQGALTVFSDALSFLATARMMNNIDGVGGIIVLAIDLNLLKLKTIKTIDMLPGLALIVLYGLLTG